MQRGGKYELIRKLATGGMAEVYLARAAGALGFEKTVVLKQILPHLADDPQFIEMFLGEARLAATLNHQNIAQVFDFGEEDGRYYLAMEYIDGPNLRSVIRRAEAQREPLPIATCVKVISLACEGLAYAHEFVDPRTGQPLGLIHRDVSADNLMLTLTGGVKVVDFGIAKSAGQAHRTRTGVIKGKVAYMAPEQVRGATLDGRADLYALGVVLYELLSGQRLFDVGSDVALINAIVHDDPVPLRDRRPDVPAALEEIIERATARDRDDRHPDCHALQADLEDFLIAQKAVVGSAQIAQLIQVLSGPARTEQAVPVPPRTRSSSGEQAVPPRTRSGTHRAPTLPAVAASAGPPTATMRTPAPERAPTIEAASLASDPAAPARAEEAELGGWKLGLGLAGIVAVTAGLAYLGGAFDPAPVRRGPEPIVRAAAPERMPIVGEDSADQETAPIPATPEPDPEVSPEDAAPDPSATAAAEPTPVEPATSPSPPKPLPPLPDEDALNPLLLLPEAKDWRTDTVGLQMLHDCISFTPKQAECHIRLASNYAQMKRTEEARKHYQGFLKVAKPGDPRIPRVRKLLSKKP